MAGMKARRIGGWFNTVVASVLLFGIWGMASLVVSRPEVKVLWDVSPQQTSSVSQETKQLIDALREREDVVEIHTFYFDYTRYAGRTPEEQHQLGLQMQVQRLTIDLLKRYEALGGANVRVIDHNEYLGLEEFRAAAGRFNLGDKDYDLLVVDLGGRFQKLSLRTDMAEFGQPRQMPGQAQQPQLRQLRAFRGEEVLSSALKTLLLQGKPVIYFLQGYQPQGPRIQDTTGGGYSKLRQGLEADGFVVRMTNLRLAAEIPEDADLVVLLEPRRELPADHGDTLANWVRSGGRLLVNAGYSPGPADYNPSLAELGSRLGFEVLPARLLRALPDTRGTGGFAFGPNSRNVQVLMDPAHPVTRPLVNTIGGMLTPNARPMKELDVLPRGVTAVPPFLRTIPQCYTLPLSRGVQAETWRPANPGDSATYSAWTMGQFFRARPVDDEEAEPGLCVALAGGLFFNQLWPEGGRDLALNLFNHLAKRQERVTIRKDPYEARILKLKDVQVDNILYLHLGLVAALAVGGFLVFFSRRRI